jgi:hypothetical protein
MLTSVDIRFSKDPTPYKTYFSAAWSRTGRKGPYASRITHVLLTTLLIQLRRTTTFRYNLMVAASSVSSRSPCIIRGIIRCMRLLVDSH